MCPKSKWHIFAGVAGENRPLSSRYLVDLLFSSVSGIPRPAVWGTTKRKFSRDAAIWRRPQNYEYQVWAADRQVPSRWGYAEFLGDLLHSWKSSLGLQQDARVRRLSKLFLGQPSGGLNWLSRSQLEGCGRKGFGNQWLLEAGQWLCL